MNWHKLFMWSMFYGLLILKGNHAKIVKKRGVMDNFNDGLKVAGQMFGINTAADVANLVAKAFSHNNSNRQKPDLFSFIQNGLKRSPSQPGNTEDGKHFGTQNNYESQESSQHTEETTTTQFQTKGSTATPVKDAVAANFGTTNLIASMLRLVGFDATKLGALAINALIMIASAIGNTIMGTTTKSQPTFSTQNPLFAKSNNNEKREEENFETGPEEKYSPYDHQPRALNDVTTIEWFLQNSSNKMKRILKEATHTDLADKLTDMIANHESKQGQASCLKMLVCKSSPFIWGMQRSIKNHIEQKKNKGSENVHDETLKDNATKRLFDVQNFFTHLPTVDEYREHGEKCEQLYSTHCNTTYLFDKTY